MHQLRNAWADHADYVSTMYSGTGALKTDFTRTGKRSWKGALEDGRRSVIRYYKNNFRDGERQVRARMSFPRCWPVLTLYHPFPLQDALDLITGSWKIRRGTPSPFSDDRSLVTQVVRRPCFFSHSPARVLTQSLPTDAVHICLCFPYVPLWFLCVWYVLVCPRCSSGPLLIVRLVLSAKGVIDLGPRAYLHLPALLIIATLSFVHIWLNGIQCVFPSSTAVR